jgi:hypothetical protein
MKSDLSKIKVGDKIWTIRYGRVEVKSTNYNQKYPIATDRDSYTIDGKRLTGDSFPSAFPFNPFERAQPFEGYWAMVSDSPLNEQNTGYKRFVFMEKNGEFIAWDDANNDEAVKEATAAVGWKYAQRIPEYTFEELTAIVGHEFKFKK